MNVHHVGRPAFERIVDAWVALLEATGEGADDGGQTDSGRAVKDAAQTLLEMTGEPEWAPSEQGGAEMAPGYTCFQCAYYEPSRRDPALGLCHKDLASLRYAGEAVCSAFRLREEGPPEDAGADAGEKDAAVLTFTEALGLEKRIQALESGRASVACLVQNVYEDALPVVHHRLSVLESKIRELECEVPTIRREAVAWTDSLEEECTELRRRVTDLQKLERLDEKRLTHLEQERDEARGRISRLEFLVEQLQARPGDNAP